MCAEAFTGLLNYPQKPSHNFRFVFGTFLFFFHVPQCLHVPYHTFAVFEIQPAPETGDRQRLVRQI